MKFPRFDVGFDVKSILGPIAGAATALIPGVGPLLAPVADSVVNSLDGASSGGGGGGTASGGTTATGGGTTVINEPGNALTQGLSAAEAAELAQQLAKGNAQQVTGLEDAAGTTVASNTTNELSQFANAVAALGGNPALASGVKAAQLNGAPQISGVGSSSKVNGGGVTGAVGPSTLGVATALPPSTSTGATTGTGTAGTVSASTPARSSTIPTSSTPVNTIPGTATGAIGPMGGTNVGTNQGGGVYVDPNTGEPGTDPSYQKIGDEYYFNGNSNDPNGATDGSTLAQAISAWENANPGYTSLPSTGSAAPSLIGTALDAGLGTANGAASGGLTGATTGLFDSLDPGAASGIGNILKLLQENGDESGDDDESLVGAALNGGTKASSASGVGAGDGSRKEQ